MSQKEMAARPETTATTSGIEHADGIATTKLETILSVFISGKRLNRFDAERHHDHCLHSTVSTLQNDYGIKIARISETVPCLRGRSTVRCKRYWLDTEAGNIAAALALLAMWRRS